MKIIDKDQPAAISIPFAVMPPGFYRRFPVYRVIHSSLPKDSDMHVDLQSGESRIDFVPNDTFWRFLQETRPHICAQLQAAKINRFEGRQTPERFVLFVPMSRDALTIPQINDLDRLVGAPPLGMVFEGEPRMFAELTYEELMAVAAKKREKSGDFLQVGTPLDGKFTGSIFRRRDMSLVPADRWVGFMAYDHAFPPTLKFYREECERIGADAEQLAAIDRLYARVLEWRAVHPELCKIPDALPGECP